MSEMTERLILRPLTAEDEQAVHRLASQPEVARYMRFSTHTGRQETAAWLAEVLSLPDDRAFAVTEREGGAFVGVFLLKRRREPGQDGNEADMSYFSGPERWNRGYAAELLRWAKAYARREMDVSSLAAWVAAENTGSCRALARAGFTLAEKHRFDDLPGDGLYVYRCAL